MKYRCRIISEQFGSDNWPEFERRDVIFSSKIPLKEADGLLAIYDPSSELLEFKGPKLWHTMEPIWHSHYTKNKIGKKLVKTLKDCERAYYANCNPKFRVPVVSARDFSKTRANSYKENAVATVNYSGGSYWWLKPHTWLRNRMITCELVDLYGSKENWEQFRSFPYLWKKGLPKNFVFGKAPGGGLHDEKFRLFLSEYKVYICLENSYEPYWFTEKFVNSVRSGCIPVYHAHPTVRETFLKGAFWVDPADFKYNIKKTIKHALSLDINKIRAINDAWLESPILQLTLQKTVDETVLDLMTDKILNK